MEKNCFYFFRIELTSSKSKEKLNMLEKISELKEARDRFNKRCDGSKFIYYLTVSESCLEFILRLNNRKVKKVKINAIGPFLSVLCKELHWFHYMDNPTQALFEAREIKKMDLLDCKDLINQNKDTAHELYDAALIQKLFENVEEEYPVSEYSLHFNPENVPVKTKSLADAVLRLENLTGLENFKSQIKSIIKFIEVSRKLNAARSITEPVVFPFHYLFIGNSSIDQVYPAKLLGEVFYHLKLLGNRNLVKIDVSHACNNYVGIDFDEYMNESDTGVVLLENILAIKSDIDEKMVISKLCQKMRQLKGKIVFILSFLEEDEATARFQALCKTLERNTHLRKIPFELYSDAEVRHLLSNMAEIKGFSIDEAAVNAMIEDFRQEKPATIEDARSYLSKLVESAIFEKTVRWEEAIDFNSSPVIGLEDVRAAHPKKDSFKQGEAPKDELSQLIGLKDVKKRVAQIVNLMRIRNIKKSLGLKTSMPCLHMQFTGNPGTGKTTVARIMGKIFKDMGLLTKGQFVEVTREDLIGEYIGQTAPKVKKVIKRALGGMLFIDEAYSLYSDASNDYGYEAIAELVKAMEDQKDNLCVIFAGYPDEMEKMIGMNPGLRDRIAFKIEFPDFSNTELTDIFLKMCSDYGYILEPEGLRGVKGLVDQLYALKSAHFGNARLIRKLFERLEILQSSRLCENNTFTKESILTMETEDIKHLLNDPEVVKLVGSQKPQTKIGFTIEKVSGY